MVKVLKKVSGELLGVIVQYQDDIQGRDFSFEMLYTIDGKSSLTMSTIADDMQIAFVTPSWEVIADVLQKLE